MNRWVRRTFTLRRWSTQPWQMYPLLFLFQVSAAQVWVGVPPNAAQSVLDGDAQFALAACNLVGTLICAYGLHLRDIEIALWIELSGYASLIGSLAIFVVLVFAVFPMPNTSYGLAFAAAFVLASMHRAAQIAGYKCAKRRADRAKRAALLDQIERSEPLD